MPSTSIPLSRWAREADFRFSLTTNGANRMCLRPRSWWIALLLLGLLQPARAQPKDPLAKQVTIYRDTYGVPHIVGDTQAATFFGYGYAQAEDHLQEMMLQYRDAQG